MQKRKAAISFPLFVGVVVVVVVVGGGVVVVGVVVVGWCFVAEIQLKEGRRERK